MNSTSFSLPLTVTIIRVTCKVNNNNIAYAWDMGRSWTRSIDRSPNVLPAGIDNPGKWELGQSLTRWTSRVLVGPPIFYTLPVENYAPVTHLSTMKLFLDIVNHKRRCRKALQAACRLACSALELCFGVLLSGSGLVGCRFSDTLGRLAASAFSRLRI